MNFYKQYKLYKQIDKLSDTAQLYYRVEGSINPRDTYWFSCDNMLIQSKQLLTIDDYVLCSPYYMLNISSDKPKQDIPTHYFNNGMLAKLIFKMLDKKFLKSQQERQKLFVPTKNK